MPWDARDWYTVANPNALLDAARPLEKVTEAFDPARELRQRAYDRRRRLFGCACARMVWNVLPTDAQSAVTISERFADDKVTRADLEAAAVPVTGAAVTFQQYALCAAGWASIAAFSTRPLSHRFEWEPSSAALSAAKSLAARAARPNSPRPEKSGAWGATWNTVYAAARAHQAELVRDIFSPPGYAPALNSDWQTSTVVALARQMDDTGDFSAVPILADALQDAGCDNDIMLERCRTPSGVHCRGNWVVDLVLGRE